MHRDNPRWPMLVLFLAVMYAAGGIGSYFTIPEIGTWYSTLAKPSWNPPDYLFGIVWNVLFGLTGIATWMVYRREGWSAGWLVPFAIQWVLNVAWSVVFFGLHRPGAAFGVIVALWLALVAMIAAYRKARPLAAFLMVPYLAWVSFAGALNYSIWQLNP